MITFEESKKYRKSFVPTGAGKKALDEVEAKIKSGNRHPYVFTTHFVREYAEELASYCRKLGYKNARIVDICNGFGRPTGGHYLKIDL